MAAPTLSAIRRTQAARTASTRARLLDATIECLDELGYARTTTPEIARRAGVSRGAQLHHFPTKAALVAAAVEHLFRRRVAEFLSAFAAVPPGADRLAAALDILWQLVSGRSFHAWLELLVASRTDPELRALMAGVAGRSIETIEHTFRELFAPAGDDDAYYTIAPRFAFTLLEGLALQQIVLGSTRPAEPLLEALKAIAALTMPQEARALSPAPDAGGTNPCQRPQD